MIKNIYSFLLMAGLLLTAGLLYSCQEEFDLDEVPPTEEDALFSTERDASTDNIVHFTATGEGFIKTWNLGNGQTGKGETITGSYPDAGTYTVTLTVYNGGGSASHTETITIAEDDPTLLDKPLFNALTGGPDAQDGKTWVIDSASAGHFGVGPNPPSGQGKVPEWYAAGALEKSGGGMYDDEYIFTLAGYGFEMQTSGNVYVNAEHTSDFSGAVESDVGDYTAPYTAPDNLQWQITETEGENPILSITQGGFLGYYTGVNTYEIVSITEDVMELRFLDAANDGLSWYIRLIRAGYDPTQGGGGGGEEPEVTYPSFPLTFEETGVTYLWGDFGGTAGSVIANPDPSGINTSDSVAQLVKSAGAETWAGTNIQMESPINFGGNPVLSVKVWSPRAGVPILLKLEDSSSKPSESDPPTIFAEVTATTTVANTWEVLTFDYSTYADFDMANTYDAISVFYDFGTAGADEIAYIDDIQLASGESQPLTLADLTGGGTKAWRLKPAAGAFGVGPTPGSDEWYPGFDVDISGDRPCLFNDLFIFQDGGVYEYDAQGDIFGEAYMGVENEGCQDEANLSGTDAEAWMSGSHSFTFNPASGGDPATITVTGTGAFIVLPKAYNGGEYNNSDNPPPPATDGSVTYTVLDYTSGASEELSLTIDVTGDGSIFWSFVLIPNS
ncbi:PKD domain-containing protein [Roseivirga sp. BDSF3-8]|uniref:PKD domain-containing protein n=1 Tax=Roseivirga sp. BDSF3-8 TaxID=3241598 RepID=UPI003532020B